MNIKHAQYIMEILQDGSITNAARVLHVSQPALSQTVKAVECFVGAPIFLRNSSPLVLTEAGKKYIEAAKRIITINTNLLHEVADLKQEERGVLHLGIPIQRAMEILPHVVDKFFAMYPSVRIELLEAGSNVTEESILNGNVDLAILTTVPVQEELTYKLIETERTVLVANKRTELAKTVADGKSISIDAAKKENFISITEGHNIRKVQDRLFATYDLSPTVILETSSIEVGKKMVLGTNAVFLCPNVYLDDDFMAKDKCHIYPIKGIERKRSCYIAYRKDSYLRKYAQDFMDLVLHKEHNFQSFEEKV